jgi:2-oxoisovalerate dehydrogenase E1 component alpha subunit
MPMHIGSNELNICTLSSPLATQIPQASGSGYKFRINNEDRVAITYFGDGAASEGDFHAALNFAATLRAQTLFFCRNNMYAISTPIDDQYAGDGIAVRGVAYGMPTIRVDGNDIFAVYTAVKEARKIIMEKKTPVLVEALSYRVGDHSTSDFSQAYRNEKEMQKWADLLKRIKDPITRLDSYMVKNGLIKDTYQNELREKARDMAREALKVGTGELLPSIDNLFEDVYEKVPNHLEEQRQALKKHLLKYPDQYNLEKFVGGTEWPS